MDVVLILQNHSEFTHVINLIPVLNIFINRVFGAFLVKLIIIFIIILLYFLLLLLVKLIIVVVIIIYIYYYYHYNHHYHYYYHFLAFTSTDIFRSLNLSFILITKLDFASNCLKCTKQQGCSGKKSPVATVC